MSLAITPPDFDDATCRQVDPEIFFPASHEPGGVRRAKALCRRCPHVTACLDYALQFNPQHLFGVWGATTAWERRQLLERQRVAS